MKWSGGRFSDGGYGYSEIHPTGTNRIQSSEKLPDLLAVVVPSESRRRRTKTKDSVRINKITGRKFDPNPKVADYENTQEVFEYFLGYADT